MPIRFSCPHCTQKLSVSTRKAGKVANCPRCKKELTVPAPEPATGEGGGGAATATAEEGENEDDPYSQFVVYDDTELVYDDAAPVSHPGGTPSVQDRVAELNAFRDSAKASSGAWNAMVDRGDESEVAGYFDRMKAQGEYRNYSILFLKPVDH